MVSRRFRNRVNLSGASPAAVVARIESLEASDAQLYREDLVLVARDGKSFDSEVRRAAISKLDQLPLLAPLLEDARDIAEAAAIAIAGILSKDPRHAQGPLLESVSVKLAVVRASRDPEPVRSLIEELEVDQLVALSEDALHAAVRRAAAERVEDESALARIANAAKNHDKSVFRVARTKLDRIKASRKVIEEAELRARNVTERLAELSEMPVDRNFAPRLKIIRQEWQECELAHAHALDSAAQLGAEYAHLSASSDYSRHLQKAEARLQSGQVSDRQASLRAETPSVSQPAKPAHPHAAEFSEEVLAQIQSWVGKPVPRFSKPGSVEAYRSIWHETQGLLRTHRRLAPLLPRLEASTIAVHLGLTASVRSWLKDQDAFCAAAKMLEQQLLEDFEAEFSTLVKEIELGNLGKANDLRHRCGDTLRALPDFLARKQWKHLHETDASIGQLRDWQAYAATPKREALCEQMAALVEQPLAANAQMDRIRALREAWKSLGPLIGGRDHEIRRRFERHADAAFAPCRAYFQEQAELRKRNLAARRQICDDLELFIEQKDWSDPDWKAVNRILNTARSEWRTAYPVDRAKAKALQRRFDDLCDKLYKRLAAYWKSNEVKARGLIVELRALLESSGSVDRLAEATGTIQTRWKNIGPMSHAANRKLWKEFRGLCDQVYRQRRDRREQENEAYRDKLVRAKQLVAKLEERVEKASIESASAGELTQLGEEWESFKGFPGESFKQLDNRWRDLARRYRQMLREGDLAQQLRLLDLAARLDTDICRAEQTLMETGEPPEAATIEALSRDAGELLGKIQLSRIEMLKQGTTADEEAVRSRVSERRRLCVGLDIDADRESPQEDKAMRLEIQVQRINQGAASGFQAEPIEVARKWCQLGPVGKDGEALSKRFFGTLKEMTQ